MKVKVREECHRCDGSGDQYVAGLGYVKNCSTCGGSGKIEKEVEIPKRKHRMKRTGGGIYT